MKVLSIEIGMDVTHVAEVDDKVRNPKIYHSFSFRTPIGVVGEAGVRRNEEFRAAMQKLLGVHKIKTRKALFVVNSGKIASREVEIPNVKEKRIRDLLNANSSEYFPVDLAQYQLVYRTVDTSRKDKGKTAGEQKRRLFVFAVPNELIASYEELAVFCSLELTGLDYVGNSVYQLMRRMSGINAACTVKVDDNATMITIINRGEVVLQRTIFYGVGEAYSLAEESGLFSDRENISIQELLEQEQCLNNSLAAEIHNSSSPMAALRDEMTESMRPMIGNIMRVLDYYQSRSGGADIRECILIGNGARMKGLDMLMGRELNIPVYVMTPQRLGAMGVNINMVMTEFFACYGAALDPLEFVFGEQQTAQIIQAKKKRELRVFKLFAAVCVCASLLMLAMEGMSYLSLQSELRRLDREKDSLTYIEDIYNEYVSTRTRYADVANMDAKTQTVSDTLADAFEEMEEKLPSGIHIDSITSDGMGITMDVKVGSKTEAAKTLEALGSFEAFSSVETGGITEVTDEDGRTTVSFSVLCVYANGTGKNQEAEETTPEEDVNTYVEGDPYIYPDYEGNNTETGDTEHE